MFIHKKDNSMNWNLVQFDYAAILIVYCLIHFKCGIVLICARIIIISRNSRFMKNILPENIKTNYVQ